MQSVSKNLPTALMLAIQAAIFFAVNRGIFTAEQALALSALLGTGAMPVVHRMQPPAKVEAKTGLTSLFIALVLLVGCGSLEEGRTAHSAKTAAIGATPRPTDYCRSLDGQHRTWGAVAKLSALLAGGSGLATLPVEDKDARTGLAIGSAAAAAIAAGAVYFSEDAAHSWGRDCSQ